MRYQVVLSHSIHDTYRASRLRHALRRHSLNVWPDGVLMPGTFKWHQNFRERIDEACCVLVLLSPNTLLSRWVALTIEHATEQGVPVLPVLVAGKADHILLASLEGLDWFDLRRNSVYPREIRELVNWVRARTHQERAAHTT